MRLAVILKHLIFGKKAEEYRKLVHENRNAMHTEAGNVWRLGKHASEILRSAQGAIDLIEKSRKEDR